MKPYNVEPIHVSLGEVSRKLLEISYVERLAEIMKANCIPVGRKNLDMLYRTAMELSNKSVHNPN